MSIKRPAMLVATLCATAALTHVVDRAGGIIPPDNLTAARNGSQAIMVGDPNVPSCQVRAESPQVWEVLNEMGAWAWPSVCAKQSRDMFLKADPATVIGSLF